MRPLQKDTVALRVSSAPSTDPGRPFGKVGLWFTRKPLVIEIAKIGEERARAICGELQLVVEQLTELPMSPAEPHDPPDDRSAPEATPTPPTRPPGVPTASDPDVAARPAKAAGTSPAAAAKSPGASERKTGAKKPATRKPAKARTRKTKPKES
jgi:hypothetical protein